MINIRFSSSSSNLMCLWNKEILSKKKTEPKNESFNYVGLKYTTMICPEKYFSYCFDIMSLQINVIETRVNRKQYTITGKTRNYSRNAMLYVSKKL